MKGGAEWLTSTKWNRPNLPISLSVSCAASLVTVTLTYDMSSLRNMGTDTLLNGHTIARQPQRRGGEEGEKQEEKGGREA